MHTSHAPSESVYAIFCALFFCRFTHIILGVLIIIRILMLTVVHHTLTETSMLLGLADQTGCDLKQIFDVPNHDCVTVLS